AQIVEDDDIIGLKFRDEHLNHIIEKTRPIDWSIDDEGSDDSLVPQPGDEGCRFPAAIGDLGADPASALGTSTMANHICLRPCFVDEDKTRGIKFWLVSSHADRAAATSGRSCSCQRLFLSVIWLAFRKRQIEPIAALTPRSSCSLACIACKVRSFCA